MIYFILCAIVGWILGYISKKTKTITKYIEPEKQVIAEDYYVRKLNSKFWAMYENKICEMAVNHYNLSCGVNGFNVEYNVRLSHWNPVCFGIDKFKESQMFNTREELIKSLS